MKKFLGIALFFLPVQAAIIIDGSSAAQNDRFANDASFIGSGFDFTGVGRLSATPSGASAILPWATMISDNVFISASHVAPGGTATFYPGNDPNATPVIRTVTTTTVIGGSDITVGVLNTPVPATIATYAYETQTISTITGANVEGSNAYLSGVTNNSGASYGAVGGTTNQAVGRNIIDSFFAAENIFGRPTDLIAARYNLSTDTVPPQPQSYTAFESLQQGGDSSAPLFVNDGTGQLKIIGITSAVGIIGADTDPNRRAASFYAYVGNYSTEIATYVTNNAVPEPSTASFFLLSLLLVKRRR